MNKKRSLCLLLILAALLLMGCSSQKKTDEQPADDGRIAISMYMWDRSMFKELSPWL